MQEPGYFTRSAATPPDAAVAFVGKQRGAMMLRAVAPCARKLGLVPGMTLADARARIPTLIVADMDEDADSHWLGHLARRCIRYSPLVTAHPPDAILIDSTGCAHLFGGETGLIMQIEEEMAAIGMTLRLAIAQTSEGALALARYAHLPVKDERAALRALPIVALGLEQEAENALRRAGLKHIGDVATRPAAAIAARFGMEAVTSLRRILGEEQAPMDAFVPAKPLLFARRFADPIGHQETVMAVLRDLLQEAARNMEERTLGGRHFGLVLFRSDGARHRLAIETGQPTGDPALLLRLFDERIAALADPLDPGFGYDSMILHVLRAEPLSPGQPVLDGENQNDMALAELIDRLSTRHGPGALRRLIPQDSHIPEQAQIALPAIQCSAPIHWPAPTVGEPPMRPLFLFDPPQPVEVIAQVPDGPPLRFRWRGSLHEVRLYEGPERIGAEWWRREGGEHGSAGGLTRDYYRIEEARGRRYWMFRHGLYDEKPDPRWYLHGLFA